MSPISSFLLFLFLSNLAGVADADDPTALVYSSCTQPVYPPNSPYQQNLNSLLSSLSAASAFSLYSQFISASASATPSRPIAGLFQCRGDLSITRCSSCIRSAISRLPSLCSSAATSASIQLRSCYLRYGNDTFLGHPDTNLRYKTCSAGGNSGGEDFLAARDHVFAAVSAAPLMGSSYRVASAGSVRAEAQCVGDLSLRNCDECVVAAASQVKVSCGGAAAGEIYLGKCYIWYSGGGARGEASDGKNGTSRSLGYPHCSAN